MKAVFVAVVALFPLALSAADAAPLAGPAAPLAAAISPPPIEAAAAKVSDIEACMRRNYADRGSLRDMTITATDTDGKSRQLKIKLHWKPSKDGHGRLNLKVAEPIMLAGSTYLLVQNEKSEDVYFHLPAAMKTQKVTGDDLTRPLWGTDFSYNDVKLVQGILVDGDTKRVADSLIAERPNFVLDTRPREPTLYSRVITSIDQASCVILKAEFFGKTDKPDKIFTTDPATLSHLDPYWFATGYSMRDLKTGTRTDLVMSDVYLLERMPEKVFDPEHFFEPFE